MNEPFFLNALYPDLDDCREIATIFLEAARIDYAHLRLASEQTEFETIVQLAHRIKGAAAMVGLVDLAAEAATLQEIAKREGCVKEQICLLEHTLERMIAETSQWLADS
ncbi:Hpt domain-containing protein [Aeromonas fluvialis]|uniref:Hpt domain-containing protein n=1 Tax=Aeromonas fluvialis TaxID=591962 RepID=UPI0005AB879C|nr:Hpt domain-containing protein [Aeromonas fluvialis]